MNGYPHVLLTRPAHLKRECRWSPSLRRKKHRVRVEKWRPSQLHSCSLYNYLLDGNLIDIHLIVHGIVNFSVY